MKTLIARAAAAALVGLGAARAEAQITTVIAAPRRVEATAQAAARREEVAQDSIARVTLTGMKQWVDSAAASLALRPDTGTAPVETPAQAPTPAAKPQADTAVATPPRAASETEFRDGARAPNTATQWPAVALGGALLLCMGLVMRRRTPAVTRSRTAR